MSNIWSDKFKEIRDPYFEIEDPYIAIEEKKSYNPSRDKDSDGDNDFADNMVARMVASGKMTRAQAIAKTKNKKYNKEEVETLTEIDKKDKCEKIDGKPGSVKNKINLNPTVSESRGRKIAASAMFNCLTDEDIYEAVTTPPAGDAQTVNVNSFAMAKAKAAKAKVAKELADLKVAQQAQKTKTDTNESVIGYLRNRYNP